MKFAQFDETLKALEESINSTFGTENLFLSEALGRYLAVDIVAPWNSHMYPTVDWLYERGKNTAKPFFLCEYAHSMGNALGNFKEYW
ncbi:MAG: glycoside hydrolase family 2 TIM barrel-domain containing protein, partial [Sulfurospirillaceae bacterium]|nr:glycoside hydrolase family 2 TIM barrel-domain containing protein [Sulfurospirillaceae bacterium]